MSDQDPHNWQHPEPPLDELDRQLHAALRGPAPPADLADRVFEATADRAMAGPLADSLREAMAVTPPADLAHRVSEAVPPPQPEPRPAVLAIVGRVAAAAVLLLAVSVGVYLANVSPTAAPGPDADAAATLALDEQVDLIEWTLSDDDDIRHAVSDLAIDLDLLSTMEMEMASDAAIEDEFARQMLYYELAEARPF